MYLFVQQSRERFELHLLFVSLHVFNVLHSNQFSMFSDTVQSLQCWAPGRVRESCDKHHDTQHEHLLLYELIDRYFLMVEVFDSDNGIGVRSAVGMSLPQNIAVEIEAMFEVY